MTTHNQLAAVREHLESALQHYFSTLDGHEPVALHEMVHDQIDIALINVTMKQAANNQTKVARLLGISRSTLRKKLKQYGMIKA